MECRKKTQLKSLDISNHSPSEWVTMLSMGTQLLNPERFQHSSTLTPEQIPLFILWTLSTLTWMKESNENFPSPQSSLTFSLKMVLVMPTSSSPNTQRNFTSPPLKSSLISLSRILLSINTDISSHATIDAQFALLRILPMLTKNTLPLHQELSLLTLLSQKVKGYQEGKCLNDIA